MRQRKRLKDDTFDPFDYDDHEATTNKMMITFLTSFVIGVSLVIVIVYGILRFADSIDNILK